VNPKKIPVKRAVEVISPSVPAMQSGICRARARQERSRQRFRAGCWIFFGQVFAVNVMVLVFMFIDVFILFGKVGKPAFSAPITYCFSWAYRFSCPCRLQGFQDRSRTDAIVMSLGNVRELNLFSVSMMKVEGYAVSLLASSAGRRI